MVELWGILMEVYAMATTPEYAAEVSEQIGRFHPIHTKKMFGGVGIFSAESGNMFALITADDILHFKVDDSNRADYEAVESAQFFSMPYFMLPEGVLEDETALGTWVRKSADIAARTPPKKPRKKKS
jgi:TfoX/Sxy family transcriptional regulator of competence genes